MKVKQTARLENWSIQEYKSPYRAPELPGDPVLVGECYDHPKRKEKDGRVVMTSNLIGLDINNNIGITQNTKYTLGKIDPDWQKYLEENEYTLEQYESNLKKKLEGESNQYFDKNFSRN